MTDLFRNRACTGCAALEEERDRLRYELDQATRELERARKVNADLARANNTANAAGQQLAVRCARFETVLEEIFNGEDAEDFAAREELGLAPIVKVPKYRSRGARLLDIPHEERAARRFELLEIDD